MRTIIFFLFLLAVSAKAQEQIDANYFVYFIIF